MIMAAIEHKEHKGFETKIFFVFFAFYCGNSSSKIHYGRI